MEFIDKCFKCRKLQMTKKIKRNIPTIRSKMSRKLSMYFLENTEHIKLKNLPWKNDRTFWNGMQCNISGSQIFEIVKEIIFNATG